MQTRLSVFSKQSSLSSKKGLCKPLVKRPRNFDEVLEGLSGEDDFPSRCIDMGSYVTGP